MTCQTICPTHPRPLTRRNTPNGTGSKAISSSQPREQLDSTIDKASAAILSWAGPDGAWQTEYNLGVVPGLMTSIAAHYAGLSDREFFQDDKDIFADAMASQGRDGSFVIYEGGPKSREQTRLFSVAAEYALEHNPKIQDDPDFAQQLKQAAEKGRRFHGSEAESTESVMFTSMVNLFDNLTSPGEKLVGKINPIRPDVVKLLLHTRIGNRVTEQLMAPMPGILPAMALLGKEAGSKAKPTFLSHLTGQTGLLSHASEGQLQQLEQDVLDWQDPNGGWVYTAVATAMSIMALNSRGYDVQSQEIQNGLRYIDEARFDTEHGQRVSFLDASVWDTAVAADALLASGVKADHPTISQAIDRLLESQHDDGRWAFALKSTHIPDTDDAAMAVRFLTRALKSAEPNKQPRMREAIRAGVDSCLEFQQKDGGWNSYEPSIMSWGDRVPTPYEAAALDPSTPDVAGRILGVLGMVEQNDLLTEEQKPKLDKARERCLEYLKDSQRDNGSWWGRWTSGLNSSPAFVLPGLRWAGVDTQADWVQECREFYLETQNPDGGWGETVRADNDQSLAGQGESTPAQTAYAILALLASSPQDDISQDQGLRKAVEYLQSKQNDGEWDNERDIYTAIPGMSYYDAPLMTTSITTIALANYRDALEHGVSEAFKRFAAGPS